MVFYKLFLWQRSLSYKNKTIDLLCNDKDLLHERLKSPNLRDAFTSPGAILLDNWLITLSAYHEQNCDEVTKKNVILKLILTSKYLQKSLLIL